LKNKVIILSNQLTNAKKIAKLQDEKLLEILNAVDEKNLVVNFYFDRLNLLYSKDNLEIQLGRQRVNWGRTLVWNPNDFFNSYSYFDFNYEEKPGSDAIRLEYYTGMTSSLELAYKIDHLHHSTYAAKYAFNQWNYDFQLIAGMMNDEYWVGGLGFSGNIGGAGINGEATYYLPKEGSINLTKTWIATLGGNYMFKNNILLNIGGLYNSAGTTKKAARSMFTMMENISALDYTPSLIALFGNASYPINPLINFDITTMLNPFDGSFYVGPALNISLSDNVSLYFIAQSFWGGEGTEYGDIGKMYFSRLQWNF